MLITDCPKIQGTITTRQKRYKCQKHGYREKERHTLYINNWFFCSLAFSPSLCQSTHIHTSREETHAVVSYKWTKTLGFVINSGVMSANYSKNIISIQLLIAKTPKEIFWKGTKINGFISCTHLFTFSICLFS